MIPIIIAGLVTGCIYAISALGLVLTYVSSRVFNFAHGVTGLFVAWCFYEMNTVWGWPVVPSAVIAICVLAPAVGVGLWAVLYRKLSHSAPFVRVAATIGVSVVIPPLIIIIFGNMLVYRPLGLAGDSTTFVDVLGVNLNLNQIIVIAVAVVVAAALAIVLRFTPFGLSMRASVDSSEVALLHGVNTDVVMAGAWAIGTTLAGLAGVLLIPFLALDPTDHTLAFIASLAAVVIGRLRNMVVTFVGAIVLGLAQETSVLWVPQGGSLVGVRSAVPFILMAVVLVAYNFWRRGPESDEATEAVAPPVTPPAADRPPWRRYAPAAVAVAVLAVLFATLSGFWVGLFAVGLCLAVVFLSYTVITGLGALISLSQISFAAIGALTAFELSDTLGWPVLVSIILGGVGALPFGLLIALPAMRWAGPYLALGTLAFGFLVDNVVFRVERYDNFGTGVAIDRPTLFGLSFDDDRPFVLLVAVVFVVLAVVVLLVKRSTLGLLFAAIRGSERATSSIGFSVIRAKLAIFGLSAFIAGVGGAFYASYLGRAAGPQFLTTIGLVWFAVAVTMGTRSAIAALVAGLLFSIMPQIFSFYLPESLQQIPPILFGLGAIGLASEPRGAVVQMTEGLRSLRARRRRPSVPEPPEVAPPTTSEFALSESGSTVR